MDTKTIIETAEEHLIHTYNRYQIVLDKGDGVHLYDTDGKEYLDFGRHAAGRGGRRYRWLRSNFGRLRQRKTG